MIRSTAPRTRAGINSSIAELIAEYSPPIPAPVIARNRINHHTLNENPVAIEPPKNTNNVIMNNFLRPIRSANEPKYNAPAHAPTIYAEPESPTSAGLKLIPLPCSVNRPAIDPTIVTCNPSKIHTVPNPTTTNQCHRDHS